MGTIASEAVVLNKVTSLSEQVFRRLYRLKWLISSILMTHIVLLFTLGSGFDVVE